MSKYQLASYKTKRGLSVRSKLEARVLDDCDRRGFEYTYEPIPALDWQDKVNKGECRACGSKDIIKHRTYLPDVLWPNGEYMEIKGLFTPDDRRTLLGVREANPGVVIRILFMRDSWLHNKRKANRYSDWAHKNGFDYAIGEGVPDAWTQPAGSKKAGSKTSTRGWPRSSSGSSSGARAGSKS